MATMATTPVTTTGGMAAVRVRSSKVNRVVKRASSSSLSSSSLSSSSASSSRRRRGVLSMAASSSSNGTTGEGPGAAFEASLRAQRSLDLNSAAGLDLRAEVNSVDLHSPIVAGQGGPPPMVAERFQNVISQLFQQRIIRLGGGVDDDMANLIVAQLLYLDSADPKKDIIMYVNSPGGSVTAGMAVFDTMKHIRPSVSTVCVGLAASMGAFILSAGEKGKRYALPNSRIMIHQPLGGAQGQAADIEIQANEILHHKHVLNSYLAAHTGQSYEKIEEDTDRDFFMSAEESVEYGLIDGVIASTKMLY